MVVSAALIGASITANQRAVDFPPLRSSPAALYRHVTGVIVLGLIIFGLHSCLFRSSLALYLPLRSSFAWILSLSPTLC